MAKKAKEHLDLILGPVGGAGAEINQLFTAYAANNGIAVKNNQAIRIGQVKHIASKFWRRLQTVGAPDIPLQPAWPYHRNNRDIWTQSANDDADMALATLGQVKSAFSFDIPAEAPLRARNFAWLWDGWAGATSGVLAGGQSLAYTNAPPQEGIPKTAVFKAGTEMSMTFLTDTTPPDPDAIAMVFTGILNANQALPYSSRPAWRTALFAAGEPIEFVHFKGQGFDETRKVYPTLEYWGYVQHGTLAADADLYYGTANQARFKGRKPVTFIHHQQWVRDQPDADGVLFDYVRPFAGGYVTSGVLAGNALLYITPTSSILCLARQPVKFVNFPSGTGGGSFAEGYVRRLTLAEDSTVAYGNENGAFRGNVTLKKNTSVTLVETDNSKGFAHVVNGVAKGTQSLLKSAFVEESVMDGEFLRFNPATGYLSSHSPAVTDNDLDNDLLPDEWEMKYGLDINFDEGGDGTHGDPDQDGVDNLHEFIHGTNPKKADTDGDSVSDKIEIDRAANPLNAADGGVGPPSDQIIEVPFRVGDDSASHSERWSMRIVGADPLRDDRKFDFANEEFGTVSEPTKFKLRKGAPYKITLTHEGTNDEAKMPDYDWLAEVDGKPASAPNASGASTFIAAGHWIVDNSKALLGRLPDDEGDQTADKTKDREAFLLPMDLAIDANRDGTIASGETSSEAAPFRFWINNDDDPNTLGDDVELAMKEDEVSPPLVADWRAPTLETYGQIDGVRDLEDFTRLHLTLPANIIQKAKAGEAQVGFKWTIGSGPRIRVYKAQGDEGSEEFLFNKYAANLQVDSDHRSSVADVKGNQTVFLPSSYWQGIADGTTKLPFIFEGCEKGTAKLTTVIKFGSFSETEGGGVWIKLIDVQGMFERGKVAAPMSEADNVPDPWMTTEPLTFQATSDPNGNAFQADPDETKQYIIHIHGWRMSYHEAQTWANTSFKRLWHLGYKGRYAFFSWPTFSQASDVLPDSNPINGYHTYNRSEYRAWLSGAALKSYVASLPSGYTKNIMAHSMGNVVVGSAFRQGMGGVANYSLLNAAMAAQAYDPARIDIPSRQTPDTDSVSAVQVNFGLSSKFRGITAKTTNFYLEDDFATTIWSVNHTFNKPQGILAPLDRAYGYSNGGYTVDGTTHKLVQLDPILLVVPLRGVTMTEEAMAFVTKTRSLPAGRTPTNLGMPSGWQIDMDRMVFEDAHSAEWIWSLQRTLSVWRELLYSFDLNPNPTL
ncbi:MAG: alpha/beta hydrolase [Verrucomicrobiota bacterium]